MLKHRIKRLTQLLRYLSREKNLLLGLEQIPGIDDFPSGTVLSDFEEERIRLLNHSVSVGALLAAALVPLFALLDLVFKPHQFIPFMTIRILVTMISIIVYYMTKTRLGKKYPYWLGAFLTCVVGGSIALMCTLDMGPADHYYAGINLPLLGFGILLPLTLIEGGIIFLSVWLTYFIPNLLAVTPENAGIFISNNFFMLSTIIIALAASQFHLYHRKNQWLMLRRLEFAHRKIKGHAEELEKKVQERTQRLLQTERLAVVGQLAGGVAHDFNNFLTAILGISELLLQTLPEEDAMRADIESIAKVGKKAAALVRQLLAFSRRQILMPKYLNLNEVLSETKKMLGRVIGENIELIVKTDPNLGVVKADPVQIEQIILNLAVNARDAMPSGGTLIIETSNQRLDANYCRSRQVSLEPGKYVTLSVSDNGTGMTKEVKTRIFEPFFTTKEKGQGTGLGLASVYGIVRQSNGDIYVYSEEGKGTTFKIFLPQTEESAEAKMEEMKAPEIPKGKETILLVEDEEEVRKLTARMLEQQGYTVMQAREGTEALKVAQSYDGRIDLLLTDVIMPNMNGKMLAEQLVGERNGLKVLFLSGYTDTMILQQGITDSCETFLQKPYTLESLSIKIRHIFDN